MTHSVVIFGYVMESAGNGGMLNVSASGCLYLPWKTRAWC